MSPARSIVARIIVARIIVACLSAAVVGSISQAEPRLVISGIDAGYVDGSLCAVCHQRIAATYARTGMGRSFRSVKPGEALPEFNGKTFEHAASGEFFTPYVRDGKPHLRRHQIGFDRSITNILEQEVQFVFGSGNHARSYLHRAANGRLIELPLSWYAENGGYWAMSPAFDRPDHFGFSREISYRCMFCHNGYPEIEPGSDDRDGASRFPGRLPEGIDCQRCHGPGRNHVTAAQRGESRDRLRDSIVNPARLSHDRQLEVCMQCHLETTSSRLPALLLRYGRGVFSYRPAEPLADYVLHFDHAPGSGHDDKFELVSAAYRLRKSACFQSSGGSLTCTSCHDPHNALRGEEATRHYTEVCRRCHASALAKLVLSGRHPAARDCVSCHMPRRRPSDTIHLVITDHEIRARPVVREPHVEEHDGNTPPYYGEVTLYYPDRLPKTPENELYLAVAQVTHQSNLPAGLQRLERAIERYRPQGSETYFELGDAYFRAGQFPAAARFLEQAVKRKPERWYHFFALGAALLGLGQAAPGAEALERALALAPDEPQLLHSLGQAYSARGRILSAVSAFRKAIARDPDMCEGPNNLGNALLQLGRNAEAEITLREALRLRPELLATNVNLANVLAQNGKPNEARYQLENAIRLGPSINEARPAYFKVLVATGSRIAAQEAYDAALRRQVSEVYNNLGTLLVQLRDPEGAVRAYRHAVAGAPNSATAYFNLGLTLADQGNSAEAEHHLDAAVRLKPDLFEAHLLLGQVLLSQSRTDAAKPHLRKASQSPDATVANAAIALLNSLR